MTNLNAPEKQRNFNKFSLWLQSEDAERICKQQTSLIKQHFCSLLTGPQLGLVNCDERYTAALENVPGLIQRISCDNFVHQKDVDFPAASLNTIIVPLGLSFLGEDCEHLNWKQLSHLLAPGGQLLVTGLNSSAPSNLLGKNNIPSHATRNANSVTKALASEGFSVSKSIFHGLSSRTNVPSIYCSPYPFFSPLLLNWAILFKQNRPSGTLVGRLKPVAKKRPTPLGNNRQT